MACHFRLGDGAGEYVVVHQAVGTPLLQHDVEAFFLESYRMPALEISKRIASGAGRGP
jgi:hypothetical protein